MPPDSAVKTATAPIVITARTTPYSAIVWPSSLRQCVRRSSNHSENVMLIHLPSYSLARADRRTTRGALLRERIGALTCTAHAGTTSVVGSGVAAAPLASTAPNIGYRFVAGTSLNKVKPRLVPPNEGEVRAPAPRYPGQSAGGRGSSDVTIRADAAASALDELEPRPHASHHT